MNNLKKIISLSLLCFIPFVLRAEIKPIGSELSESVDNGYNFLMSNQTYKAKTLLNETVKTFQSKIEPDSSQGFYRCFQDKEEYNAYKATKTQKVFWVDESYIRALRMLAFFKQRNYKYKEAKDILLFAKKMAPFEASVLIELGFNANREKNVNLAFSYYNRALKLSKRFRSQSKRKLDALRGLGFTWAIVGDLDKAEKYLKEVLAVEPNDRSAQRKLIYIKKRRRERLVRAKREAKRKPFVTPKVKRYDKEEEN